MKSILLTILLLVLNICNVNAISLDEAYKYYTQAKELIENRKYDEAMSLLETSARSGFCPAAHQLGGMYDKYDRKYGNIEKSENKACYWYKYGMENDALNIGICRKAYENRCKN